MQTSYRSVKAMVARFFVEKIMLSGTKKSLTFRFRKDGKVDSCFLWSEACTF